MNLENKILNQINRTREARDTFTDSIVKRGFCINLEDLMTPNEQKEHQKFYTKLSTLYDMYGRTVVLEDFRNTYRDTGSQVRAITELNAIVRALRAL